MKIKLMLFIILGSAIAVLGQGETKIDKKEAKQQAKFAENERKNMTVDFVQLTKFPASYLGKPHRLYRIGLGDIKPYTDEGVTYYPIALSSGTESTFPFPTSDAVTFIMAEDLAKPVVTEITRLQRTDPYARGRTQTGDVYFELYQKDVGGKRFFIAKVTCIAIIDFFSEQKRRPFGECPLVK